MKILFGPLLEDKNEEIVASEYFITTNSRVKCFNEWVIGRYLLPPALKELEYDLRHNNCKLINSYEQHKYIANFYWYDHVKEYTFPTWFDFNFHEAPEGQYVVKGKTNSKKHRWNKEMFSNNKREALAIANELMNDTGIGDQGVVYRKYVPLETFEVGINGLRICNEFRFFYYKNELLAMGYYWSNAQNLDVPSEVGMIKFADKIASIIAESVNFFVLDIAKKEDGGYILVETNDGMMSGLSEVDPNVLYGNLKSLVK